MTQNVIKIRWFLFFITLGILWLVFAPLVLYCILRFKSHRNDIIIHKRLPNLTLLFGVTQIICMLLVRPLALLQYILCDESDDQRMNDTSCGALYYGYFLGRYIMAAPAFWIIFLRFWLIFYEANWVRSTLNKDWKIHLNPGDVDKDWYLNHKSNFGQLRYCALRMFFIYVLCFGVIAYLRLFYFKRDLGLFHGISGLFSSILPTVVMIVMSMKMNRFEQDAFHIIREMKLIALVISISVFSFSALMIVKTIKVDWDLFYKELFATFVVSVKSVFLVYFQTLFVLRLIDNDEKLQLTMNTKSDSEMSTLNRHSSPSMTLSNTDRDELEMEHTFRSNAKMEHFIRHLANEWCVEIILAFIEITQYQDNVRRYICDSDASDPEKDDIIELDSMQRALLENDKLPKSHIVYQSNPPSSESMLGEHGVDLKDELTAYKLKGYLLFQKYVDSDCGDLQINISYRTRQELTGKMKRSDYFTDSAVDGIYLFSMYTAVVEELFILLNQSYARFLNEKENCLMSSE